MKMFCFFVIKFSLKNIPDCPIDFKPRFCSDIWSNGDLVYWRIHASPGLHELSCFISNVDKICILYIGLSYNIDIVCFGCSELNQVNYFAAESECRMHLWSHLSQKKKASQNGTLNYYSLSLDRYAVILTPKVTCLLIVIIKQQPFYLVEFLLCVLLHLFSVYRNIKKMRK